MRLVLALLLVALAGCAPRAEEAPKVTSHVVIFVPGLYGTELRDRGSGALRWPSLPEILFRRRSVAVCARDGAACESLAAGEVVQGVSVVPGVYRIDVYGRTLARLRASLADAAAVRTFAYDWRQDVSSQARALDRLVDAERRQGHRVSLVAHSLGGLVVSYYLRYGAQDIAHAREDWAGARKVDRVVLAGVPYGGSALAFVDLAVGRAVAGNPVMFDARTYQSFASTYELLPPGDDHVLDERRVSLRRSLLDVGTWQAHGWGAFAPGADAAGGERRLRLANLLRERLQAPLDRAPPDDLQLLLVRGTGRRTLDRVIWRPDFTGAGHLIHDRPTWERAFGKQASRGALYADGDSVVTDAASALPAAWAPIPAATIASRNGHRDLLLDDAALAKLAGFLAHR